MTQDEVQEFFRSRVPPAWFAGGPKVEVDDDEILCTGVLPPGTAPAAFRETTREERIAVAAEAEQRFGRKVSWAVEHDGTVVSFTTLSTPVMSRLRFRERAVLDTLIEGGVARSRSEALAWCVRLVGQHQAEWLADLREALAGVEHVRGGGPTLI